MLKRQWILAISACCLLAVIGCNKNPQPPQEPSESDGIPTAHDVLVVDVEEKIVPPPEEPNPAVPATAPAAPEKTPATAPATAPAPATEPTPTPAPQAAPKQVATAQPAKPNPLKAAFDKKDVLAVAEETPSRPAPKGKAPTPEEKPAETKDKSPAEEAAAKKEEKTKDAAESPDVKAVRDAVTAFAKSVETAEEKTFLASIAFTKTEEPIIKTMWGFISEMSGFEKDMKKAYGQKGEEAIKKNQQMRIGASVPSLEDIEKKMDVKVSGNQALASVPNQPPMSLVKQDGKWKVQLFKPGQMQGPQAQMMTAMMQAMARGVKDARKKIGQPGYTPEKVMQEISKAMMPAPPMMPPKGAKK
jgi:hypothetical protein